MADFTLFGRSGCHLCEEAGELLRLAGLWSRCQERDIDSAVELHDRYGLRIPVLRRECDGAELDWPFGPADAITFMAD
ncbi:MAG: glutaredoxin family protein [Chromatiales bacterium]|nr:glutaredoxin family protein [Chromatiales bacterium]